MPERTARLHIRLMGAPEISTGARPLALNHLKSRALLYYLVATRQSHSRDHLATLLWGESGQSEAYHSLRSSLYHLRKALLIVRADKALISDGDLLSLNPVSYQSDVLEFHRLLTLGDEEALSQAVALRRGSFLQGFTVPGASMFDDWVQMESTRLNHACFEAMNRLTSLAKSRDEWAVAIGYLKQMLQIDPLAESVQQQLMRLYLHQGEWDSPCVNIVSSRINSGRNLASHRLLKLGLCTRRFFANNEALKT